MFLDNEWVTGYRYLCVYGHQMDHRTDYQIQWTNLTISYMDRIVARSDWFYYFIIVRAIASIPVDCNHYF